MSTQNRRPTLLRRMLQKLKPAAAVAQTAPAKPTQAQKPRKEIVGIEPLEGRIAPATILNPSTVIFTDMDGDTVTIEFSKPLFNQATPAQQLVALEAVFDFQKAGQDGALVDSAFADSGPQYLKLMDLTKFSLMGPKSVAGDVSLTITADDAGPGDGFTTVGRINGTVGNGLNAQSIGLGKVVIDGRLVEIDAGGKDYEYGIKSLTAENLGPEIPTGENPVIPSVAESTILGKIGSFTISEDMRHATLQVKNVAGSTGDIEKMTIGGSLIGLTTSGNPASYTNSGNITAAGDIKQLTIGSGQAGDGIIGGMGAGSGSITAGGVLGKLTVDGDLVGGLGGLSGSIFATKGLGKIQILGDVRVDVAEGSTAGFNSATIRTDGGATSVFIEGSIIGNGASTGGLEVDGVLKSVTINGNLEGRSGTFSGFITSDTSIGTVMILGDVKGSADAAFAKTGIVSSSGSIGSLTIGGDLIGGAGESSGTIHAGLAGADRGADIQNLTIEGQIIGGSGDFSGSVIGETKLGKISVKGGGQADAIVGGAGDFSGVIYSSGSISSIAVTGNLAGGEGAQSGAIIGHGLVQKVNVSGDVVEGTGERSGGIFSFDQDFAIGGVGQLGKITVGGSVTGAIYADASIASLKAGSLATGSEVLAGMGSGGGRIGAITVNEDVTGATIRAAHDLGSLTIKGSISDSVVTAVGQALQKGNKDVAIGKITVNGNVTGTEFLAGHDAFGGVNGDAQIGKVKVKGNWAESSLVAGALDIDGDGFGDADDVLIPGGSSSIVARIASVIIGGSVSGSAAEGDHFGFVAEDFGKTKINLGAGTTDVAILEVTAAAIT